MAFEKAGSVEELAELDSSKKKEANAAPRSNSRVCWLELKVNFIGVPSSRSSSTDHRYLRVLPSRRLQGVSRASDRKMTTWFLGLMGFVVIKGGIDFFSDNNRNA
ncbi:hypothetical protein BDZ91DRAFT_797147 [Kalaharituber pfeilii]|nr:hypothetical protein BDZ91DRAFT_797147 [Kalaharituber pfeilii]